MAESVVSLLLLFVRVLAVSLCIVAVLGPFCFMSWHWHKELGQRLRLRQTRSTHAK